MSFLFFIGDKKNMKKTKTNIALLICLSISVACNITLLIFRILGV